MTEVGISASRQGPVAAGGRAGAAEAEASLPPVAARAPSTVALRARHRRRADLLPQGIGARWVATGGLGVVLWLSLYLVLAKLLDANVAAAASFATAVWVPCLEAARRAVPPSIGPAFAASTGTAAGVVLGSAIESWLHFLAAPLPPLTLLAAAGTVFAGATAWWHAVDKAAAARKRVMIVGTSGSATEVAAELASASTELFEVVGAIDAELETALGPGLAPARPELTDVLREQRPDLVVVADEPTFGVVIEPLLDLGVAGPRVVGTTGFFEHAFGRVPIDRLGVTWFTSLLHLRQRPHSRLAKRVFDLVGAAIGLVVLAPLFGVVAALIRLTAGPVIYRQVRIGQGGKPFEIYKFRTMRTDAEQAGCCQWACRDDPRVTAIGRLLRKTHVDELPQLWNVLRGDMSLVGPRPERPAFVEQLEEAVPFWGRRLLIKPGLTGWAQLHSGYASDVEGATVKLSYDLWYLRHRNVVLDLAICVKTVTSLLAGARGR